MRKTSKTEMDMMTLDFSSVERDPESSGTIVESEERNEPQHRSLRNLKTWKLTGTETSLTLQHTGEGRCSCCKKFALPCTTRITNDGLNETCAVRCDECRSLQRRALCDVDIAPVLEQYPHLLLRRGTKSKATKARRTTSSNTTSGKHKVTSEPSTLRKKTSTMPSNNAVASSSRSIDLTHSLSQDEANRLIARTLLRQSIVGIENDSTNTSAVVQAFVPGLKSAYDLLFPEEPL